MKNKKQIVLALALAFAGVSAQAAGLDLNLTPSEPAKAESQQAKPANNTAALGSATTPAKVVAQTQPAASVEKPTGALASMATSAKNTLAQAGSALKPASEAAPSKSAAPTKVNTVASSAPAAPLAQAPAEKSPFAPAQAALTPVAEAATVKPANPFTGKATTLEQRQYEIEMAKMETDLLQERVKQAALTADLTYLPVKKQAEISMLPNVAKMQKDAKDSAKPTSTAAATPKKATKSKKKKADAATPVVSAPVVAPEPQISVSSISINGTNASVVLESQGNILSARHGESTQFGAVQVIDSRTVRVGGRQLTVRDSVVSRMTISDPVPVDPKSSVGGLTALQASSTSTAPSIGPAPNPPLGALPPNLPPMPALPRAIK